jgi:acetyl esterase/lipase
MSYGPDWEPMASARRVHRLRRPRPLLRAILELINATNGFRPLSRNGYLSFLVFWFGWPTSELPTFYLGASVLDLLRRGLRGDLKGRRGAVALAVTAASWVVLALIRGRVLTSGPLLQEALRAELGSDYAEALKTLPTTPSPTGRPSAWRTTAARRRYVGKDSTVRYGPHGRANLADIWRRRDLPPDGKAPVLVQVPGGGWAIGMRRPQAYPLMSHFADRGWICVSLAYRVSPRHTWPDHIVDVKRALSWVKDNIASFGGDPDFVAITGGSAGGHLASLVALSPNDPVFQPGFEDADTSVVAAVPLYGRYDWVSTEGEGRGLFLSFLQRFVVKQQLTGHRDIYIDASPIRRTTPNAPPFFVVHGRDDSIIPVAEAREFVAAMHGVSKAPVAYVELPHTQHGFDIFGSIRAHDTAEAVGQFLSWVYATKRG